jgi:hypothetical protein
MEESSMFLRAIRRLLPVAAVAIVASLTTPARADGDPAIERIAAAGHSLKWNWTPPGRDQRYGHAEVLINAPLATVRAAVSDFGHYKDLVPDKFHTARIVGKQNGNTDVYMQVPILNGIITLWDVVRFEPVKVVAPGLEVLEGKMIKGNVRDMNAIWTTQAVNDSWTLLKFDLLLSAALPAPQSAIDEELRDAAMRAVDAIHDRAQGHPQWVPWATVSASK